jgi:transcriptional regulator with XRE-family HTH domain
LAKKVGVSYNTVGNIEKGRTFPQPLVRQRIAQFFGTDEWLSPSTPAPKAIPPSALPPEVRESVKRYDIIQGPPGITIYVNPDTPLAQRRMVLEMAAEMQRKVRENKG